MRRPCQQVQSFARSNCWLTFFILFVRSLLITLPRYLILPLIEVRVCSAPVLNFSFGHLNTFRYYHISLLKWRKCTFFKFKIHILYSNLLNPLHEYFAHKAATRPVHPLPSFAVLVMLFQSNRASLIPVSMVILHVPFALPGFLFPDGDHFKNLLVMLFIFHRSTWPKFLSWF